MRDFSDWEVEEAHIEHENGTTAEALAERLGTTKRTLARAFRRLEDLEGRVERIDGMLYGMGRGAASRIEVLQRMVEMHQAKLEETERRIEQMERKLNHKGGDA